MLFEFLHHTIQLWGVWGGCYTRPISSVSSGGRILDCRPSIKSLLVAALSFGAWLSMSFCILGCVSRQRSLADIFLYWKTSSGRQKWVNASSQQSQHFPRSVWEESLNHSGRSEPLSTPAPRFCIYTVPLIQQNPLGWYPTLTWNHIGDDRLKRLFLMI